MTDQLGSKSKKIKAIQNYIDEMYKRLESSYKIDRIVDMENKIKDTERINNGLLETISDLQKVKSEQKVSVWPSKTIEIYKRSKEI